MEIEKRYFLQTQPAWDKKAQISTNDVAIGCPICNEGKSAGKKQRFHLYKMKDTYLVHCFNCGYHKTFYNYLKEFDLNLLNSYNHEKGFSGLNSLQDSLTFDEKLQLAEKDVNLKFIENPFIPITESKIGMRYLYSRGINVNHFRLFYYANGTYKLNVKGEEKEINLKNGIIIPLLKDEKWYGFQYRSIDRKHFFTYLPEENANFKVFNYFNTTDDVYVFESVFDMLSNDIPLKNKIAGLGSDVNDEILKHYKKVTFCLDNQYLDMTSWEKSKKYAKNYSVFIWEDIPFKDFNELLKTAKMNGKKDIESKITKMIKKNVYTGFEAEIKLKLIH